MHFMLAPHPRVSHLGVRNIRYIYNGLIYFELPTRFIQCFSHFGKRGMPEEKKAGLPAEKRKAGVCVLISYLFQIMRFSQISERKSGKLPSVNLQARLKTGLNETQILGMNERMRY